MVTKIFSAALSGMTGDVVEIEADTSNSLPAMHIVGLPDTIVQESRERIRAAIKNSSLPFPRKKVTINLAPADLRKEGTHFDLPIAVAILRTIFSDNKLSITHADMFAGELGLSGKVRSIKGVLSMAMLARKKGFDRIFIPQENIPEAMLVEGITCIGVKSLLGLVAFLSGQKSSEYSLQKGTGITKELLSISHTINSDSDFAYIQGQEHAKRALEIAAAGNHNVFMQGSPGAGKTLLARSLATILPPLSAKEMLEVTRLYSVAGEFLGERGVIVERPFRSPHHTASTPSLVGGGITIRPGEITLAHRGVLFLDELGEFQRSVLESLRQPLEEGTISVARAKGTITFPARCLLVVAQNPCPCGYYGDTKKECICTIGEVQRYNRKISGPLLDRIDMHLEVPAVAIEKLADRTDAESSAVVCKRVTAARSLQIERYRMIKRLSNSELSANEIKKFIMLSKNAETLLTRASDSLGLSARSYYRVLRVARTIADLAQTNLVVEEHIAEAIQFRRKNML